MDHRANRTDVWGQYLPLNQRNEKRKLLTQPPVAERGHRLLSLAILTRHFRGERVDDVIGLHAISKDNTSRWVAWDIDMHVKPPPADAVARNRHEAIALHTRLRNLGLRPLLYESDGRGGYHIVVVLREPVESKAAHAFASGMAGAISLPTVEVFPKQARIAIGGCGSLLRLPGRHHEYEHFSRVYVGGNWAEGTEAINEILATVGDDPQIIKNAAAAPAPPLCDATNAGAHGIQGPGLRGGFMSRHHRLMPLVDARSRASWRAGSGSRRGESPRPY